MLEQSNHIGGMWWFDEKAKSCVLPNLTSNARASELSFPGFPFEDFKGDFPTPSEYCLYLQSFVDKFDLEDSIRFNAQVDKVTPSEKDPSCWVVQITDLSINVPMVFEKVDFVVLANGHYQKPRLFTDDEIPGVDSLPKSMQIHSSQFRSTALVAQKNVLVVGLGASGVEVLRQVALVAQEVVACSMRMTGSAKSPRGARANNSPRSTSLNSDLSCIQSVRPRIKSISKSGEVTFDDRSSFKPDLIIWCTGFVYDFPMLPKQMIPMSSGYPELYLHMFPLSALCFEDNFAVIGLPSVNGTESIMGVACEQSKFFAALATGKCELPSKKVREAWIQDWKKKPIPAYRPLRVEFKAYVTELNNLMGLSHSVVVQDRSFQNSRINSASEHSSEGEDEEGETEEGESGEESATPRQPVEKQPAVTVAQPAAAASSRSTVEPQNGFGAPPPETAPSAISVPTKKLSKSEGMVLSKEGSGSRPSAPSTTPPPPLPSAAPPTRSANQNVAPSPAMSRINSSNNSSGNDLQSSKTGVFASFKRTPTKDQPANILDRLRGEKKVNPYPDDLLRKRVRMLNANVHPLMVCVPVSAACGEIGKRELMEDTHVLLDRIPGVPENIPSGIWCVYDGHGGQEVSRMAEQLLHVKFQKMLINALIIEGKSVNDVNVERLLRRCFKETDKAINERLWELKNSGVGSTAAVCVLLGRRLFVANAGDSEVVVSMCRVGDSKTSSVEMSHKHKPRDEREKLRIETMGGMVFGGRVYGTLSVARGFGDTQFVRKKKDTFLVSFIFIFFFFQRNRRSTPNLSFVLILM